MLAPTSAVTPESDVSSARMIASAPIARHLYAVLRFQAIADVVYHPGGGLLRDTIDGANKKWIRFHAGVVNHRIHALAEGQRFFAALDLRLDDVRFRATLQNVEIPRLLVADDDARGNSASANPGRHADGLFERPGFFGCGGFHRVGHHFRASAQRTAHDVFLD